MHCKNWKTILPFAITFLVGVFIADSIIKNLTIQNNPTSSASFSSLEKLKFTDQNGQDNYYGVDFDRLFKAKGKIESKIRVIEMTGGNSDVLDTYRKKRDEVSKHIENKIRSGNEKHEVTGIICSFSGNLCDEE